MLTAAQLELRRTKLGMSEIYGTIDNPWKVWYQKATGKSLYTGGPWGDRLEPMVADDYLERQRQGGRRLKLLHARADDGSPVTLPHPRHPWLVGTPDRLPVAEHCPITSAGSLETLRRLVGEGYMRAGLECKTNQAIFERHAEEDDRWGDGLRAPVEDLVAFLTGRCEDPLSVARDLMARYSLQSMAGADIAGDEEDQWGAQGSAQMPRGYLIQNLGYMDQAGADEWHLHRFRAGFGRFETTTYVVRWMLDGIDMREVFGLILDGAAQFVRDHMHPIEAPELWKPPVPKSLEHKRLELARVFPKDNGSLRQADRLELVLLEDYRAACIQEKRAEVLKDMAELELKNRIGTDKGLTAKLEGLGNVSWGWRNGKVSVDAQAALDGLCSRLTEWVPAGELERFRAEALTAATKQGEPFRKISRPQAWTKGLEDQIRAELAGKQADDQ